MTATFDAATHCVIIVTGSRNWSEHVDPRKLVAALERSETTAIEEGRALVIRVGDCPTGIDHRAREWAREKHVTVVEYRADWQKYGHSAGPRRNAEMVADGAELALASWDGRSRGTLDTIRRCVQAGIEVRINS